MLKNIKNTKGYTLVEILVAATIFAIVSTIISATTINIYQIQHRQKTINELNEETRFLMERIVRHARVNTIDYTEYFAHNSDFDGICDNANKYGKCTTEYEDRFWCYEERDGKVVKVRNEGAFNTNADTDCTTLLDDYNQKAIDQYEQEELYLISKDGREKTIIKRISNQIDDDRDGEIDEGDENDTAKERIAIAKLIVASSADDGVNDIYKPHPDFVDENLSQADCETKEKDGYYWINDTCMQFIPITHPLIEVTDLKFYVSPLEDPRKAFKEFSPDIQMQPHVTIVLEAKVNSQKSIVINGEIPNIKLQTMISSRVYKNVLFPEI